MTTEKGVWNIQQVRDKQLQSLWTYTTSGDNHTLWSWGYSVYGSLGFNVGDGVKRSSPTQIPGTSWKSASRGTHHGMATRTDGTLWTWGKNENGELGQNKQ